MLGDYHNRGLLKTNALYKRVNWAATAGVMKGPEACVRNHTKLHVEVEVRMGLWSMLKHTIRDELFRV